MSGEVKLGHLDGEEVAVKTLSKSKLSRQAFLDLLARLVWLQEVQAAHLFRQMLSAVAYLHGQEIVHCDLTPQNFLFESSRTQHIKLIDFGLAQRIGYRLWSAVERSRRNQDVCGP